MDGVDPDPGSAIPRGCGFGVDPHCTFGCMISGMAAGAATNPIMELMLMFDPPPIFEPGIGDKQKERKGGDMMTPTEKEKCWQGNCTTLMRRNSKRRWR
jgi:hypothetical protein